ncbi:MAG: FixH family protein [Gammaproteobacteria bacterium]|nr:FixH family protein [Gammaproteobacteria bacterium]
MGKPRNPVLVLVIALPLLAVAGSFVSLALALARGDTELPKNYHWEGGAFDRDQELEARAARLGIGATLAFDPAAGQCVLALHGAAAAGPATLRLGLVHPTEAALDRQLLLRLEGGRYRAACSVLPPAHWWLELADEQDNWLVRGRLHGDLHLPVRIGAAAAAAEAR